MWEATAGGSALQGENPLECVKRELREETGILIDDFIEVVGTAKPYIELLAWVYPLSGVATLS